MATKNQTTASTQKNTQPRQGGRFVKKTIEPVGDKVKENVLQTPLNSFERSCGDVINYLHNDGFNDFETSRIKQLNGFVSEAIFRAYPQDKFYILTNNYVKTIESQGVTVDIVSGFSAATSPDSQAIRDFKNLDEFITFCNSDSELTVCLQFAEELLKKFHPDVMVNILKGAWVCAEVKKQGVASKKYALYIDKFGEYHFLQIVSTDKLKSLVDKQDDPLIGVHALSSLQIMPIMAMHLENELREWRNNLLDQREKKCIDRNDAIRKSTAIPY